MDNKQQKNGKQLPNIGADEGTNETIHRPSTEVKSITNIYYDCLERIYDLLDLENLSNAATTCRRLQIAAAAYFGDAHGKKTVSLLVRNLFYGNEPGIWPHEYYNIIEVNGRKFFFPFLRCFGAKISNLNVCYDTIDHDLNDYVDRYINQYCAKTLKSILFHDYFKYSIEKFPNPFECVEKVDIFGADLGIQLPYFVALFPSLRDLNLREVSVDENCTAIQFPNLENFSVVQIYLERLTTKSLTAFLHANRQLQTLELEMVMGQWISWNELLNATKGNPLLTKLKFRNEISAKFNQANLMRFASGLPSIVELHLLGCQIAPRDVMIFIRQLKSLKIFQFQINDQAEYDQLVSQLDSEWKHEQENYRNSHGHEIHITLTR